jgi:L-iditol 2-dehydrogenase
MTVRAAVLDGPADMSVREISDPEPVGKRSVLVRIGAVGVCGSDIARYRDGKAYHYPLVLGHEFSAIVEEAPAKSPFAPGDRATVFPLVPNHDDPMSEIGDYHLAADYDYFGSRRHGGLQERLYVPEANLVSVGDLPLLDAAMVEPAAVALHGVRKLDLPADATALVIGGGPIGAFAAQWLQILGATRVMVADVDRRKLDLLSELGIETIDANTDTETQVMEATGGRGVDCSVEASGLPQTLRQAIMSLAPHGQVLLLGDIGQEVSMGSSLYSSILRREARLIGTWNSLVTPRTNSEWDMVVSHLRAGRLVCRPLVSHVAALDDAPQVFADMASRAMWYSKVMFAIAEESRHFSEVAA